MTNQPNPYQASQPSPSLAPSPGIQASVPLAPTAPMPIVAPPIQPQPAPVQPQMQPQPVHAQPHMQPQPVQAQPHMQPQPVQAQPHMQPAPALMPNQFVQPELAAQPAAPIQPSSMPHAAQQQYSYAPVAPAPIASHEGGETALPAISIQAFCERSQTASAIHETQKDWRMKRANVTVFMGGLPAAIEYYRNEETPALVLVESGLRGPELFSQLEQLAAVCSANTKVVIIGASNDIHLYRQLMEKGISDYIVPPFHPLTVIRSIAGLYTDPEQPFSGRITAFFGAKGGVGSSTMAHNIAWCLAEGIGQQTALIDMDMSWGTTGLDFAYDTVEGLEHALANPDRLDETLLDRIMVRHTDRLSILPASASLEYNPISSSEAFEGVVESIRKISSLSILDLPHYWNDWTMQTLNSADDIVITAMPDLANLRNTKNLVEFLKAKRPNDALPLLILNMTGLSKKNEISVKDFGAAVGLDPALVVGFDPDMFYMAANDGKMLAEMKSSEQVVNGLTYLASRLKTGEFGASPSEGGGRGMSLLRSRKASKGGEGQGGSEASTKKLKSIFASLPFGR